MAVNVYVEHLIQGLSKFDTLLQSRIKEVTNLIQSLDSRTITDVNKTTTELHKKFTLEKFSIDKSDRKVESVGPAANIPNETKVYRVSYKYLGTDALVPFCAVESDKRDYTVNNNIHINTTYKRVALIFKLTSYDVDQFEEKIEKRFDRFFKGVALMNERIDKFNSDLIYPIQEAIRIKINDNEEHNNFLNRMNNR